MTPIDYNNPNDMWRHNGYDPYKELSDKERMKAGCLQMAGILVGIIVALLICALFGSCTTTKYVPVPEYHTDTTYITKQQRDSIWLHDSIYVHEWTKGDTIFVESRKWLTKYVEKQVHDTIYQSKRDSIPYPVEVIKEVERPLSKTQKGLMGIGLLSLLCAIVAVAWRLKKFIPWA